MLIHYKGTNQGKGKMKSHEGAREGGLGRALGEGGVVVA